MSCCCRTVGARATAAPSMNRRKPPNSSMRTAGGRDTAKVIPRGSVLQLGLGATEPSLIGSSASVTSTSAWDLSPGHSCDGHPASDGCRSATGAGHHQRRCEGVSRCDSARSILQSSLPIADGEVRRCVTTASVPPRTSSPSLVDSTRHTASPDSHALS